MIINGKILFFSNNVEKILSQLEGKILNLTQALPLRDDISTDEITPIPSLAFYDEKLGKYPYTGLTISNELPIKENTIIDSEIKIIVAGKRYGKGSSREHSPFAEKCAGIKLIIAESFERIYRQNADNLGLITSTDFSLIERLQKGESILLSDIIKDRDELTQKIIISGGLINFCKKVIQKNKSFNKNNIETIEKPKSYAQKIIEKHIETYNSIKDFSLDRDYFFVKPDWRFIHEYYTGMCLHLLSSAYDKDLILYDSNSIISFEDHFSYMHKSQVHIQNQLINNLKELSRVHRYFTKKFDVISHGYLEGGEGSEGISHALMTEKYALPGQLITGTDSHTPHSGAVGALAFGVGTTDIANSFASGLIRMVMPKVILVKLNGELESGVTAKDIVLALLALNEIKNGAGIGCVFEFTGQVISILSTDERATLCNMTAELGGFTGIIIPDNETITFLKERRNIDFEIQPWMQSDENAEYFYTINLDCSTISPMVALPGDPGNGIAINKLIYRNKIDIAYGGSCTAGKQEDFDYYYQVLSWAVENNLKVSPHTELFLQFGTSEVKKYCERKGYIEIFKKVGANLLEPACGACANCGPGSSISSEQATISAINRNFPGRSGPGKVWLASPPTVAASAIAGKIITFNELKNQINNYL